MNENTATKKEDALVKTDAYNGEDKDTNDYIGDLKIQADEYGQKLQDAAVKAKDYASEKYMQANEKFKELQDKDPQELVEEAKEYARKNPGQTILISAAAGLLLGWLIKGGRR
jgi:ElaB/YqjD/DUF883 family membrane-anchored ribosome-binding protein